MEIKTHSYSLPKNIYVKECFKNILISQWWVLFISFSLLGYCIYIKLLWAIITTSVVIILYLLFWLVNLYGIQYLPQSNIIFSKAYYSFSGECIKIFNSSNSYGIINWKQVKKIKKRKNYVVMFLTKAHIIYVPFSAFNSSIEKEIFLNILKTSLKK